MNSCIYCVGMGSVTSISNNCYELSKAIYNRYCGIERIKISHSENSAVAYGALIKLSTDNKYVTIAETALLEALNDAGLDSIQIENNKRLGVVLGTSLADTISIETFHKKSSLKQLKQENTVLITNGLMEFLCNHICEKFKIRGPSYTVSNTCVSGLNAIGLACQLIDSGKVDFCIVGGIDIVGDLILSGLDSLKALSNRGVLEPFLLYRDGIILGEAAGFLVLSNKKRDKSYGLIRGFALSNDGVHLSAPDRKACGLIIAINKCLEMGKISAESIECIYCSGTGTKYNDSTLAIAISTIWRNKEKIIPVTSIKPLIGHTLGASGIIESMAALIMMKEGWIAPIGVDYETDPKFIYNYLLHKTEKREIRNCILFGSGFSGSNGAVVLEKD